MFISAIALLFAMLLSSPSFADIRVMALNTEWLWTPYDGQVDGSKYNHGDMSKESYLDEVRFYASLVRKHKIDILAVSEIENQYVAKDLANHIGGAWNSYFVQGRDTATGQDLALLSHLDVVKGSVTHFGFPCGKVKQAKKRKCLSKIIGARFYLTKEQKESVRVISSHFLSKRKGSKAKTLKRQSQALALVKASKQDSSLFFGKKDEKLIVLGDFNDIYESKVINILRKKGGLHGALDCPQGDTKTNKRRLSSIDHILFSGLRCTKEYAVSTGKYSDHNAVISILR